MKTIAILVLLSASRLTAQMPSVQPPSCGEIAQHTISGGQSYVTQNGLTVTFNPTVVPGSTQDSTTVIWDVVATDTFTTAKYSVTVTSTPITFSASCVQTKTEFTSCSQTVCPFLPVTLLPTRHQRLTRWAR